MNRVFESFQLQPDPDHVLITCTFVASKLENYHTRVYKKIQDVLAEVAGLSNAAFVLAFVLVSPYSKLKLREALMNELFDVIIPPKTNKKGKKSAQRSKQNVKQKTKSDVQDDTSKVTSNDQNQDHENCPQNDDLGIPQNELGLEVAIRRLSASAITLNMPKIKSEGLDPGPTRESFFATSPQLNNPFAK